MLHPTSKRDLGVALLMTVGIHVGFFFAAAAAVAHDLIKGKVEKREKEEKQKPATPMELVYEDEFFALPEVVPDPVVPVTPLEEPAPEMEEPKKEPDSGFVQTREDQEIGETPDETNLIGERDTKATSEEEAVAGEEKMAALAGEEDRKSDPKTFDSSFQEGEQSGPSEGSNDSLEAGQGDDQVNQEMSEGAPAEIAEVAEPTPAVEENKPMPTPEKLPTIENALAALEEEIAKEEAKERERNPVEPRPERPKPQPTARERREASKQDGGFAPQTRKTRVAGVISARGKGSLDVANTPAGRYQALVFKRLESAWQMENIRNRSLLAPGNITLYFMVDSSGEVSRQRQVARVGASGTQLGMILRALESIKVPKMPQEVLKELDGDPLEIIVTFNY